MALPPGSQPGRQHPPCAGHRLQRGARLSQPDSGRLQADSFPLYHRILCTSSTGSGAVYQTPLPLSSCKNSINAFFLIRNAGTGDVVDCSDRSNLAFITKAVCLLSARVEEVLFNHRDGLRCESGTLRRKPLAQVGPLRAGLSPFPAVNILQNPGAVLFPTYPFHGYHQNGRPDGSRVDAVAPAVVVDPDGDGEDAEHDEGRSLRLVKLCQGCAAPSTGSVSSPTPFLGCSPKAFLGSVPPALGTLSIASTSGLPLCLTAGETEAHRGKANHPEASEWWV